MPSRHLLAGDTVYVRATVVEEGWDYVQVLIDDGSCLSITTWAPTSEVAKHEDIGRLKPIRRRGAFLER